MRLVTPPVQSLKSSTAEFKVRFVLMSRACKLLNTKTKRVHVNAPSTLNL
jgi:hypothetical protein